MRKFVVLLSGGLDSTVNLFAAQKAGKVELALTFNYGQRAAAAEERSAHRLSLKLAIPHKTIPLPFFSDWGKSSLINQLHSLPLRTDVSLTDMGISEKSASSVWVPNRNGIFLNIAAGFAEAMDCAEIVPGFNAEEAATFPDNSISYIESLNNSLSYSTKNKVKVSCFTTQMSKIELVKLGNELKVQWNWTWPCYQNFEKWCGECESCQRAKRAFSKNGVSLENFMA